MMNTDTSRSNEHSTAAMRLLFGFAGWPHPLWQGSYFPADLPNDWQFSYFANEAGCLVLSATQWQSLGYADWSAWLEDVPEHFRFYLETGGDSLDLDLEDLLQSHFGAWLLSGPARLSSAVPVWRQLEPGAWGDAEAVRLIRQARQVPDLRAWRTCLSDLPHSVEAFVLEAPHHGPQLLSELRVLAELLGR